MVAWLVRVESSEGDVLVPESWAQVYSLSRESAFLGVKVLVLEDQTTTKSWPCYADHIFMTLLDGSGEVLEAWRLRMKSIQSLPAPTGCLYFAAEGDFRLIAPML